MKGRDKAANGLPRWQQNPDPDASPPLLLELVLPFLSTVSIIRCSQCSHEARRLVRESGQWKQRAADDFGIQGEHDWEQYVATARISAERRHAEMKSAVAWREYCGMRLVHYSLQVSLCAWGALIPAAAFAGLPRAVASGQPLLLPAKVAMAIVASGPLLPIASVGATLLVAGASADILSRLSPARRNTAGLNDSLFGYSVGPASLVELRQVARRAVGHARRGSRSCRVRLVALGLACLAAWLVLGSVAALTIALPWDAHLQNAHVSLLQRWTDQVPLAVASPLPKAKATPEGWGTAEAVQAGAAAAARLMFSAAAAYRGGSRSYPSPWAASAPQPPLPPVELSPAAPFSPYLAALLPLWVDLSPQPWEAMVLWALVDFPRDLRVAFAAATAVARLPQFWPALAWLGLAPFVAAGMEWGTTSRGRVVRSMLQTAVRGAVAGSTTNTPPPPSISQWCALQTASLLLFTAARAAGLLDSHTFDVACAVAGFAPLIAYWIVADPQSYAPSVLVIYASTLASLLAGSVVGPCTLPPLVPSEGACRDWPPVIAIGLGVAATVWALLQLCSGSSIGRVSSKYWRLAASAGALDAAASLLFGRNAALALIGSLQNTSRQRAGAGVIPALGEPERRTATNRQADVDHRERAGRRR